MLSDINNFKNEIIIINIVISLWCVFSDNV